MYNVSSMGITLAVPFFYISLVKKFSILALRELAVGSTALVGFMPS